MSRTNTYSVMLIVLAAVRLAFATSVPPQAQSKAELVFKAATDKEVVDGDLKAAIELYRQIAQSSDRAMAARALVRIGQCYEKLGALQASEARKAYEQVVREYADQTEPAGFARTRLAAIRRPSAEAAEPTIHARRLLAGRNAEGDFSGGPTPDGRSLISVDSTAKSLAMRDLATGASRLIANRDSEKGYMAYSEIVSPDGRRVAYAWVRPASPEQQSDRTELRVVGIDGSGDRLLREERGIYPSSWSRDGRHIAAEVYQTEDSDTEIAWISVEDGSKRTLGTFPRAGGLTSHSRDDRFVAVQFQVSEDSGRRDISLLPTKGGGVVPLVDHPADDVLVGWIPGTSDLLFTSDRSGNRDLWAIRIHEGGRAEAPRPVRRGIGEVEPMGFTRDGSLFYSVYTLQYNIFIAPFDESSGQVKVSEAKPIGGRGSNIVPSWSPNGEYLAFARRRPVPPDWTEEVVCVLNTKTGQERLMVEDIAPATVPSPRWFPDGRSLLVLGIPQSAAKRSADKVPSTVYRVDLATGAPTRLFDFPPDRNWWRGKALVASPDGEGVIYVSDGRMVLRHLQSGKEEELYRHPNLAGGMRFSPDGSELTFVIRRPAPTGAQSLGPAEDTRLMIMRYRGGDARELTSVSSDRFGFSQLGWTSDGGYVLFMRREKDRSVLMRVPREGGKVERLWETQERIRGLSRSRDGRHVAYFTQENEAEIWVLENIKEVLARAR